MAGWCGGRLLEEPQVGQSLTEVSLGQDFYPQYNER